MIPDYFTPVQERDLLRNPQFRQYGAKCPVCLDTGSYRYLDNDFECPDDDYGHYTMRLAKLYWMHNIDLQYQQLVWDEFPHAEVKETVETYIKGYQRLRLQGMGLTLYSPTLGTGKTWAATQVLKEVVKAGYDGWFANFFEVKNYFEIEDKDERAFKVNRVTESEILVLDEVKKPYTTAQHNFFSDKLEDLIRPRTNANFPTLITTNMTPAELDEYYPRIYSLVMAKNLWVELPGLDARAHGEVMKKQMELALNGEAWPIT